MKKKILLSLGLVAALMLSAVVVIIFVVDADDFRGFIEDRAERVLDRDVELGELHLSLIPVFGLQVEDVSVSAKPTEGGGEILSVRSMYIGARLLPLLSKRLEVTSLVLVEPSLTVARDVQGRWNVDLGGEPDHGESEAGGPEQPDPAAGLSIDSLRVTDGRFSFQDASRPAGRPLELDLTDLDVVLSGLGGGSLHAVVGGGKLRLVDDRLTDQPLELVLDDADLGLTPGSDGLPSELVLEMTIGGDADGARVTARGELGGAGDVPTELHLEVLGVPLVALRPLLPAVVAENVKAGKGHLTLDISGRLPDEFTTSGDLRVDGMKIEPTGDQKIDAQLDLDITVKEGGGLVEVHTFDIAMGGNTIAIIGTIEGSPEGRQVDLTLEPTRMTAADLSFLLALGAADLGLSIAGASPVEIEGGLRGPMTDRQTPEVRGRMRFSGITVNMAALTRPVSDLSAEVMLVGTSVDVTGLRARVGDNDLAGTIKLVATDVPTVEFNLQAQYAKIDELLALMAGNDGEEAVESAPPEADSFLRRGVADGTLRVAKGSWANTTFRDLDARLQVVNGVATLDPVSMELYDGRFRGRLVRDLKTAPPSFEFAGNVEGIEMAPFLADQFDGGDLLAGRLTGRVAGRGSGAEQEAIIQSFKGEGTASIADGKVGKLDVLGSVAQVAGVLGQRTLANLATSMTTDATQFSQMVGKFHIDGGRLRFEDLLLESVAFSLGGAGDVDLVSTVLTGAFQVQFSPEVSTWMKQESSRAAELFWDSKSGRVTVPLGLSGPFGGTRASVDWTSAAEGLVQRKVEDKLSELLGGALGGSRPTTTGDAAGATPVPPTGEADATTVKPNQGAVAPDQRRGESPSGKLVIEITKTGWGGSILAQDYKIEGEVSGPGIERLWIEVVDASGNKVEKKDITNIAQQPNSDAKTFKTRADGKKLVLSGFPVKVKITAVGADGETAQVVLEVTR